MEGIALYKSFKEQVEKMGPIKLAWFTTFTFDVRFVEKFILSALAGIKEPNELRTLKDFEILNDQLFGPDNQRSIDIRIFHDFRAMQFSIKQTSVQTFGIAPAELDPRFANGIFHPKVGILVNEANQLYLITGSANLTMSGWSSNTESMVIEPVTDIINAESIVSFFRPLLNESGRETLDNYSTYWQKHLSSGASWVFAHSFNDRSLFSVLKPTGAILHVWSPYFSDDVANIIDEQFDSVEAINIIPYVDDKQTVNMHHKTLNGLRQHQKVTLLNDDNLSDRDKTIMIHAKVWLTQQQLAIGSWNFTRAGTNLLSTANNIEAGIVYSLSKAKFNAFFNSCAFSTIGTIHGKSEEAITTERDGLLFDCKIHVKVYADWDTKMYSIECETPIEANSYFLYLPGYTETTELKELLNKKISFKHDYRSLLKDRVFVIYAKPDKTNKVYIGLIIELNPQLRPSLGFQSIRDFISAWSDAKPEKKTQLHELNYNDEEGGEETIYDSLLSNLNKNYGQAWFTMFLAFGQMKRRIEESKDDQTKLKALGYRIPGSVEQLSEHLSILLQISNDKDKCEKEHSDAYVWFIINEGNQVINTFNNHKAKEWDAIETSPNITIKTDRKSNAKTKKWLNYIAKECKYDI